MSKNISYLSFLISLLSIIIVFVMFLSKKENFEAIDNDYNNGFQINTIKANDLVVDKSISSKNISTENLMISNKNILEYIYPVGSIYLSMTNTNPSTLFKFGSWVQIKDRFLLSSNNSNQTGGSKKLTVENLPKHNHNFDYYHWGWYTKNPTQYMTNDTQAATFTKEEDAPGTTIRGKAYVNNPTTYVGNNEDFMPPYITCYCYQRIK